MPPGDALVDMANDVLINFTWNGTSHTTPFCANGLVYVKTSCPHEIPPFERRRFGVRTRAGDPPRCQSPRRLVAYPP